MSNGFFGPFRGEIRDRLSADHERNESYTVSPKRQCCCHPSPLQPGLCLFPTKAQPVGPCWAFRVRMVVVCLAILGGIHKLGRGDEDVPVLLQEATRCLAVRRTGAQSLQQAFRWGRCTRQGNDIQLCYLGAQIAPAHAAASELFQRSRPTVPLKVVK
jgi:hypothetical protein